MRSIKVKSLARRKTDAHPSARKTSGPKKATATPRSTTADTKASAKASSPKPAVETPKPTKQQTLIVLLQRSEGATLAELRAASGWQAHSVRGFLSGQLKKAGLTLTSQRSPDGTRRYTVPRSE